jgi:hypothetical protein
MTIRIATGLCIFGVFLASCIAPTTLAAAGFLGFSSSSVDGVFAPASNTTLPGGTYNFSSVDIPLGVTVTVTGTTPLQIYSQGIVEISGTLDLSGQNGASSLVVGNIPVSLGGSGGGGGGFTGGSGGYFDSSYIGAQAGQGPGGGGAAGSVSFVGVGSGGGGGGHASMGQPGVLALNQSGTTTPPGGGGASYGNVNPFDLLGGSGGGGGDFGIAFNGVGAGGGGGGGAVRIWSDASILISGSILVGGGDGGDTQGNDGGAGGGGSGGAVWLQSPLVDIAGLVDALGGEGGDTTATAVLQRFAGAGGDGANGFIRIDAYDFVGATSPSAFVNIVDNPTVVVPEPTAIALWFLIGLSLASYAYRRLHLK